MSPLHAAGAAANFVKTQRVGVEKLTCTLQTIGLWISEIVGMQHPGIADTFEPQQYTGFRIRTGDYFTRAADMHMREPFQLASE